MKLTQSITPGFALACATLISLLTISCSSGESEHPAAQQAEDTAAAHGKMKTVMADQSQRLLIKLDTHQVPVAQAQQTASDARAQIYLRASQPLALSYAVEKSALVSFCTDISTSHSTDHSHAAGAGFLPGIKIFFGVDPNNGNAIKLFFQKLYLCTGTYTAGERSSFTISAVGTQTYSYASGQFGTVTATEMASSVKQYTDSIRFRLNGSTRSFRAGNTVDHDARAVIIPLELFFRVLTENNSSVLGIWHYKSSIANTLDGLRHSLVFGPNDMGQPFTDVTKKKVKLFYSFANIYANKSCLCPPSCDNVSMIVASDNGTHCQ